MLYAVQAYRMGGVTRSIEVSGSDMAFAIAATWEQEGFEVVVRPNPIAYVMAEQSQQDESKHASAA